MKKLILGLAVIAFVAVGTISVTAQDQQKKVVKKEKTTKKAKDCKTKKACCDTAKSCDTKKTDKKAAKKKKDK